MSTTEHKAPIQVPDRLLANWQEMVDIMAEIVHVPAALIMRAQEPTIEVCVASKNEGNPYQPGANEILAGSGLYCETVLRTQAKLLVPDARSDAVWDHNPDIKLNMISYLGFPILLPDKSPFGTICVLDRKPNSYSPTTEKLMVKFRDLIESNLAMLFLNQSLGDENRKLTEYLAELQALRGIVPICSMCKSIRDNQGHWHTVEHYLIKHPLADFSHGICPECAQKLYPGYGVPAGT
jgi:GAF domain-containing protein